MLGANELMGDVARTSVRSVGGAHLLAMPRDEAATFLRILPQFAELLQLMRKELMRASLREVGLPHHNAQALEELFWSVADPSSKEYLKHRTIGELRAIIGSSSAERRAATERPCV